VGPRSLNFFYLILPAALGPGFTQPPTEISTRNLSGEQSSAGARSGPRGSIVIKALCYKSEGSGSGIR
jgi:hypothetical protein